MTFRLLCFMFIGFGLISCDSKENRLINKSIANVYESHSFELPYELNFHIKLDSGYANNRIIDDYEVNGYIDGLGKKQGYWIIKDRITAITYKGHFKDNMKNEWWEAYLNNELILVGQFKNNKKVGCWKFLNVNLNSRHLVNFVNDTLHGTVLMYSIDSTLILEGEFALGIENNYWKTYHSNGRLNEQGTYYNGLKNGWWQSFDTLGNILTEASYSLGEIAGYVKEYSHGRISAEGKEFNGKKRGTWKQYDQMGNCISIKEYED